MDEQDVEVVVVGAGLAGLSAARQLARQHEVVVLERHSVVGGRLATEEIETPWGTARFDAGAQFFTVRTPTFQVQVDDWLARGVAVEWCRGFGPSPDGYSRYVGAAGMASLASDLAGTAGALDDPFDVRLGAYVFSLRRDRGRWRVVLTDATELEADRIVLTCPIPQARALLIDTDVELPPTLLAIGHERTLAVMAALDRPSAVPEPGGVQLGQGDDDGVLSFVADNQRKGISEAPAVTCHAGDRWSTLHWGATDADVVAAIATSARAWLGDAAIVDARVRRWRLATPHPVWPDATWLDAEHTLAIAGDAFAGPRVEGAYLSGVAAASAIDDLN